MPLASCTLWVTVCYADDLALLGAALRFMLHLCEHFAESHGLRLKTQLIYFERQPLYLLIVSPACHSVVPCSPKLICPFVSYFTIGSG